MVQAQRLRPWCVLIAVAALMLALILQELGSTLVLSILLCLIALLPFIQGALQKQTDWFEPIFPYAFLYMVYYGVRTIYLLYVEPISDIPRADMMGSPYYTEAVAFTLLGFVTFLWGYFSGVGDYVARRLPAVKASHIPSSTVLLAATVVFVIALVGRLYLLATGKILAYAANQFTTEPWENIIAYPATFGIVAFALAVAYQFRNRKIIWLFWILVLPAEMLFWFLRGSRTSVLFAPFSAILLYHYIVNPLSARKIFAVFATAFLGMAVSYPLHTTYRDVTKFGDVRFMSLPQDLERQFGAVRDARRDTPAEEQGLVWTWRTIIEKSALLEGLAATISSTEQWGYIGGRTLLMLPALWIPQILWPSKNEFLGEGNLMAAEILFGAEQGYGLSVGQLAELYLNFGLVGVAVGMFVIGVLLRGFYSYCCRDMLGDFGPVIYSVMWPHLVYSHGSWLFSTFGDSIRMLVLILLLLWIMRVVSLRQSLPADKHGPGSHVGRKGVVSFIPASPPK